MRIFEFCAVNREGDRDRVAEVWRAGAEFLAQDCRPDGMKPRARNVLFNREFHVGEPLMQARLATDGRAGTFRGGSVQAPKAGITGDGWRGLAAAAHAWRGGQP